MGFLSKATKAIKKAVKKAPGAKVALGTAAKAKKLGLGAATKTVAAPAKMMGPGNILAKLRAKQGMAQGIMGRGIGMGKKIVTSPEKIAAGVTEKMKSMRPAMPGLRKGFASAPGQMKKAMGAPAGMVKDMGRIGPMGMKALGGRKLRKPSV
jgi:hypothetical protein